MQNAPAVLVVDDDDEVRETIRTLLSDAGFTVQTAASGWEALAILDKAPVDLMVADIRLPGELDGLAMVRNARARHPTLKCLFISGHRTPVVCDPALDDFVAKPFRLPELLGCVWKVLRGNIPRPRAEIAAQA
jgi:two-component system, OmpR family, response regulator